MKEDSPSGASLRMSVSKFFIKALRIVAAVLTMVAQIVVIVMG